MSVTVTQVINRVTVSAPGPQGPQGNSGGDITTDAAWTSRGDLIVGTGTGTAVILNRGTAGQVLTVGSSTLELLEWATPSGGSGSGDVVGPASSTDNAIARFDSTTGKLLQNSGITIADGASGTLSGTNTGDQTSIVGITGTIAQFNTACSDADFATGGGTATGTNTGDQTSVTGNAGTVTVSDAAGDTTTWVLLGTSQTGSLSPATDAGLTYNATTNALTATTFVGALTGNSTTATALATGRTIAITGDVTYTSPSFDGSANVTAAGTIANAAVSLAKMANLAQDQFIIRTTASTGVPETATCTAAARTVLDDTTVAAMVDTLGGAASNGTGGLARLNGSTFTAPILGTPASGTLTNCTGLPVAGGGTGAATFTDGGVLVGNGTGAVQVTSAGTAGYPLVSGGAGVDPSFSSNAGIRSIAIIIGDGTNAITTAMKAMVCVPYGCTIIGHDLVSLDSTAAAVTGSIVLDVWKDTYANWPPTNADSITASAKPTLSSASKTTDSTLTGWTTGITAGDYLVVEVESVTTCKQVILTLKVRTT